MPTRFDRVTRIKANNLSQENLIPGHSTFQGSIHRQPRQGRRDQVRFGMAPRQGGQAEPTTYQRRLINQKDI